MSPADAVGVNPPTAAARAAIVVAFQKINELPHDHRAYSWVRAQGKLRDALAELDGADHLHDRRLGNRVRNPLGPAGRMAVAREFAVWATASPATHPAWDVTTADELLEFALLVQADELWDVDVDRLWRLLGYWYEGAEGEDLDPADPAWPVVQICEAYLDQVDAGNGGDLVT